uniref:RBR-type E3 ubiquitin transferase n=1 Tax=Trichuris muris TaxID=70415 RepID=A0A5S6QZ62_TRIMR
MSNSGKSLTIEEETNENFSSRGDDTTAHRTDEKSRPKLKNFNQDFEVVQAMDVYEMMLEVVDHASCVTLLPAPLVRFMLERCRWDVNHFLSSYYENGTIEALCRKWNTRNPMLKVGTQPESDLCGICFASQGVSSALGPQCGHRFCSQCWQQYATEKMGSSSGGLVLICPAYDCHWPVDDRFVINLLTNDEQRQSYLNLVTRTFIKLNKALKQCPRTDCTYLLRRRTGIAGPAVCKCGYEFCFECCEEWHEPVECYLLKQWLAKCELETDSAHWIADNTRPCPRCNTNIEKAGGCNHMRCTQPFCQFEFCWTCQGPWEDHLDEFYVCKKAIQSDGTIANQAPKYFLDAMTYHFKPCAATRRFYEYSLHYRRLTLDDHRTKRLNRMIERNMVALMKMHNVRWIDTMVLEKMTETLKRCMRTVKYTIVFTYYLRPGVWARLTEAHEERLEDNCKRLLELLEVGCKELVGNGLLLWRQEVVHQRVNCLKFEKALLNFCREGYNENRWRFLLEPLAYSKRA